MWRAKIPVIEEYTVTKDRSINDGSSIGEAWFIVKSIPSLVTSRFIPCLV